MDVLAETRARFAARTNLRINSKGEIAAILLLAAALRLAFLDRHGLTSDEIFAYWITRVPWTALPRTITLLDRHPPLFYAILKTWAELAGTGESALRFLPACFGVGTTALTYVLARKVVQERAALLAAFLVAASPFQVMASQEARMYALLGLLVVGCTTALIAAAERGRIWSWAGYAALALLMVYTHNFGFLVLLAHGFWIAIYARRQAGPWLTALGTVAVAYLPWLPFLAAQTARPLGIALYKVGALRLAELLGVMYGAILGLLGFGGSAFGMEPYMPGGMPAHWISLPRQAVVLAPLLALIALGVAAMRRDGRGLALVLLPPIIVLAAATGLQALTDSVFPRVFSFLVPFYAIVLAAGIGELSRRCRGAAYTMAVATAVVLAIGGTTLARYYVEPGFWPDDWRGAAAVIVESAAPGDFFVYVGPVARSSLAYYDREPHASMMTVGPSLTREAAEAIGKLHARLWLVTIPPYTRERPAILSRLGGSFTLADGWRFGAIWVDLLRARR